MTDVSPVTAPTRLTARALIVGERIDTAGLERPDMISSLPLAFRVGERGMAALFRFGVAVMVGLSPLEEEDLLAKLRSRVSGFRALGDDETAVLEIAPDGDEQKSSSGPIQIKNLSPPRSVDRRRAGQDGGAGARRARGQRSVRRNRAVCGQARGDRQAAVPPTR